MRQSQKSNLVFDGTPARIVDMINAKRSVDGDIYLDYEVTGNKLDRPGLSAFLRRIADDQEVSVVFVPRRDRLARPDDPEDGTKLEKLIRRFGVTICFQDRTLAPLQVRQRLEVGEEIQALLDYSTAGQFRRELANKMIYAQKSLAEQGFSAGGRPPFFLRRWLIDPNGVPIRELAKGEVVRQKGHHVAWLPSDDQSLGLALRIVDLLEQLPASRVAKLLTSEGVPSPDAHRIRTDNGVEHQVSGAWHVTTIMNVVRGMYLLGTIVYGRRSMGDQMRYSPHGPRELTDADIRDGDKPKVVLNPEAEWTKTSAKFAPLVDPERLTMLLQKLDQRSKSQRGKPRSRDPQNNPLGTRVFDWTCGWPMYRVPITKRGTATFQYKCGAYMQSHGAFCEHNHVDGPQAANFALRAIRQRLIFPSFQEKVRRQLEMLAAKDHNPENLDQIIEQKRSDASRVEQELSVVKRNLSRAASDAQFVAISEEFEQLSQRVAKLRDEAAALESRSLATSNSPEDELAKALTLLDQVYGLAQAGNDYQQFSQLFNLTNLRMFLRFAAGKFGKRKVQRFTSGMITLGDAPPPIEIYTGNTGRHALKEAGNSATKTPRPHQCGGGENVVSDGDGNSLGNVSRGDRI